VLALVDLSSHGQAIELISSLRERANRDDLAIVALSASRALHAAAEHLKAGASDFLAKPFEKEEYFCRVYGCIDRVENMRRIKHLAFTDSLTGLSNRLAFFNIAPDLLSSALREGETPVVALLSVDDISAINEAHGYAAGDQVLAQVGGVIFSNFGPGALSARFSGQQFCVFLRDITPAAASKLFERVRSSVERLSSVHDGETLSVTLSCGVVSCEPDEENIDSCLNRAASALDDAEAEGGNRVVVRG
jgi:diguanylate cyclase (GGDEF)-like protein